MRADIAVLLLFTKRRACWNLLHQTQWASISTKECCLRGMFWETGKNNRWAIDMTLLEHKGQLYAVWSGWENSEPTDKTQQHLYIAKMENPWTMASGRVKNIVAGPLL